MSEQASTETISQEDLTKSLLELEEKAKGEAAEPTQPKEKVVATDKLAKAVDAIKETGSEELKKALEVSDVLGEFAGIMGVHMDHGLETLQKAVDAQGKQNLAMLGVLTALKKSVDQLKDEVAKLGAQPGQPVKRGPTQTPAEPLNKSTPSGLLKGENEAEQKAEARKVVLAGMSILVKNAKDPQEAQDLAFKTAKFESTGSIDKVTLQRAHGAFRSLSQAN